MPAGPKEEQSLFRNFNGWEIIIVLVIILLLFRKGLSEGVDEDDEQES